jgi:membrane peptidoglycan carboxypeptidase
LTVIWIGFDDNRDLGLTGGASAAPVWADFMLRATALAAYRDVKDFAMPDGVQSVLIDPESLELATPNCPTTREEVYVAGSAPTEFCELHGGRSAGATSGSWISRVFGGGGEPKQPQADAQGNPVTPYDANRPPDATGQGTVDSDGKPVAKKKNPLQKIFGIFGGKKKDSDKAKPQTDKPSPEKGDSP